MQFHALQLALWASHLALGASSHFYQMIISYTGNPWYFFIFFCKKLVASSNPPLQKKHYPRMCQLSADYEVFSIFSHLPFLPLLRIALENNILCFPALLQASSDTAKAEEDLGIMQLEKDPSAQKSRTHTWLPFGYTSLARACAFFAHFIVLFHPCAFLQRPLNMILSALKPCVGFSHASIHVYTFIRIYCAGALFLQRTLTTAESTRRFHHLYTGEYRFPPFSRNAPRL